MRTEIAKLHHRLGATMIYVTHDQTEAMTMADRIVVLRAGQIEQVGTPIELYERPANTFVAGFLGAPRINLMPANVVSVDGETVELACAGDAHLTARVTPGAAKVGDRVTLGLRPEILAPADEGPLQGVVEVVEQLGSMQLVYATMPDGTPIVAELRGGAAPAIGSAAKFSISPGTRHIFDAGKLAITRHERAGS
jgi:multiple sugar transport system ATP-binding protein